MRSSCFHRAGTTNEPITAHALGGRDAPVFGSAEVKSAAAKTWRADPPSPHDLRRTFATRLSGLGVSKEDRDALLNHIRSDVGSKHYDLYERAKEKRAALNQWAAAVAGAAEYVPGAGNRSYREGRAQAMRERHQWSKKQRLMDRPGRGTVDPYSDSENVQGDSIGFPLLKC